MEQTAQAEKIKGTGEIMEQKGYKVTGRYAVSAQFEISVETNGLYFLIIYGKHVNGYYCCIPNWNVSCEMCSPEETLYNEEKLKKAATLMEEGTQKVIRDVARTLSIAIKRFAQGLQDDTAIPIQKTIIEELEEELVAERVEVQK